MMLDLDVLYQVGYDGPGRRPDLASGKSLKQNKTFVSYFSPGLGSRQIFLRLRLLTFFSSGSGSWFFSQAAPAPDIFFLRLRLQGAKKKRLRLLTIG